MPTKTNLRNVHESVSRREDFEGSNLNGTSKSTSHYLGQLPHQFHEQFRADQGFGDFYVVHSYMTPIAWFANGQWFVPNVKYSVSTSRQLSSLRISNPTYP